MPCAAVQQLPHVRRGACDWTVGGEGGRDVLVPFCDCRWQCFLLSKCLKFTLSFDEKKLFYCDTNGQFDKNKM
jgi:hypothetical protein